MEENGQLVQFIFNTDREVVAEKEENKWITYIRGSELLASSNDHARTYYHYATDEMSSITHIVDDRNILNEYEYDVWGNVVNQKETIPNRFKFNGQQLDPITQQYYLRARFYNPVIARFTQEDTYRGDGLNLYTYCRNNPIYYTDPTGNKSCPGKDEVLTDSINNSKTEATETYYRTMSKEDFDHFENTREIPATGETFISPTYEYSSKYEGVTVEIQVKQGTEAELLNIGVRNSATDFDNELKDKYGGLPLVSSGWGSDKALFKLEDEQINIGLGKGLALEIFNANIVDYKKISYQEVSKK